MSTIPSATRPAGIFGRFTITLVMAATACLAFTFSFGNVWALALRLGVAHPIAPLIAPMVDLSVVGLLVALHYLSATGTPDELRAVTRLLHLCGLLTLGLNTAEPVLAQHYGRAFLDAVAPVLLLGWGHVGPIILRRLHSPTTATAPRPAAGAAEPDLPSDGTTPTTDAPAADGRASLRPAAEPAPVAEAGQDALSDDEPVVVLGDAVQPAGREPVLGAKRTGRRPAASMDELAEIARPAVEENGPTQAVIRTALREAGIPIASDRLGKLTQRFKDEQASQQAESQAQPSAA
ncbi:DUF2637 domain-containing protein [Kitasatospora acidiphila]|uniref:DUF2637 domain-containing protein n=1 Tax=Kitasatospora acidiphila TaxID=2567942 RepID=A0A540W6E7_9ACTN|nr:DUF2637 domain-containing protein [Kitasatospora acidiphila]TQF04591.1 DUF2637 domain-containing protein [Kitasatospora acidiphila]